MAYSAWQVLYLLRLLIDSPGAINGRPMSELLRSLLLPRMRLQPLMQPLWPLWWLLARHQAAVVLPVLTCKDPTIRTGAVRLLAEEAPVGGLCP